MTFGERFSGAIRLSSAAFEDVEADKCSLQQALVVVVLSATATAIGSHGRETPASILLSLIIAIVGWMLWSGITFIIGTTILKTPSTHADWGQLLRTTGFATAPGVFAVLGILPLLGGISVFVASLWMLAAYVVAVRQALDYTSTLRALAVCAVGWVVHTLLLMLLL